MDENRKLKIMENREMMKAYTAADEGITSDQREGLPQPPLEKPSIGVKLIPLTHDFEHIIVNKNFLDLLNNRTSKRNYSSAAISLDELAFLLWATQGIKKVVGKEKKATFRTVPSAGARHPFETYLFVNRVDGLKQGLYRYLASEHKLEFIRSVENQADELTAAYRGQTFFGNAPIAFVWTAIPYRSEWRYSWKAQKYILIDAGHVCQNLYLACEAIDCGTCAIGAYDQALADKLLGLDTNPSFDNENEFVVYAAAVGKVDSPIWGKAN